jgi:hypothetical protein
LRLLGFDDESAEAAMAYSEKPDSAQWFVLNYRFRLVNSFVNALETGAPLTLRALLNQKFDLKLYAEAFLDEHDWLDYGPKVYQYASDVLEFLHHQKNQHNSPIRADILALIKLEYAGIELMRHLAANPPQWPTLAHKLGPWTAAKSSKMIVSRAPWAVLHSSPYSLSSWLRDKPSLGLLPLPQLPEHLLVVLPNLHSQLHYIKLPQRAKAWWDILQSPVMLQKAHLRFAELGLDPHHGDDDVCLQYLFKHQALVVES